MQKPLKILIVRFSSIGDIVASLFCVIGILSQLIWRNDSKKGSKLDLSMLDCQVAILENAITRFSIDKKTPYPLGNDHPSISPFGVFKTKDGVIAIAAGNDKIFQKMSSFDAQIKIHPDRFQQ